MHYSTKENCKCSLCSLQCAVMQARGSDTMFLYVGTYMEWDMQDNVVSYLTHSPSYWQRIAPPGLHQSSQHWMKHQKWMIADIYRSMTLWNRLWVYGKSNNMLHCRWCHDQCLALYHLSLTCDGGEHLSMLQSWDPTLDKPCPMRNKMIHTSIGWCHSCELTWPQWLYSVMNTMYANILGELFSVRLTRIPLKLHLR